MPDVRVALVLATSTGGVGAHVASLVRGLVSRGLRVLVCGPVATEQVFGFTKLGADYTPVGIASGPRPMADAHALIQLRRVVQQVDLVHAHGLRAGLIGRPATPRRTPYVVTWHNAVPERGVARQAFTAMSRLVARGADVTLGASADLVAQALALGGRDVRLHEVAAAALPPPGRTAAEVRAEMGAGNRPLLLAIGRLHAQKGHDMLVRAAVRWNGLRPVPLVVVAGDGPRRDELTAAISHAGAPMRLLGRRTDIADLLGAADIVVLPSRWEARALVAQEALAAGRPLVCTAVGGLADLVGDAAVVVPSEDVDALDSAVRTLLSDPVERADLSRRALARAAQWPTEADAVAHVAAVYSELLGRPV